MEDGRVEHLCPYQRWALGTVFISSPLQPWLSSLDGARDTGRV